MAGRVWGALNGPYVMEGCVILVGARTGAAIAARDGGRPDLVLNRADAALYRTKNDGRSGVCFF